MYVYRIDLLWYSQFLCKAKKWFHVHCHPLKFYICVSPRAIVTIIQPLTPVMTKVKHFFIWLRLLKYPGRWFTFPLMPSQHEQLPSLGAIERIWCEAGSDLLRDEHPVHLCTSIWLSSSLGVSTRIVPGTELMNFRLQTMQGFGVDSQTEVTRDVIWPKAAIVWSPHQAHKPPKTSKDINILKRVFGWFFYVGGFVKCWFGFDGSTQCCNSLFVSFRRLRAVPTCFSWISTSRSWMFLAHPRPNPHAFADICCWWSYLTGTGQLDDPLAAPGPDLLETLLPGRLNDFVEGKEVRLSTLDFIYVNEPWLVEPVSVGVFFQGVPWMAMDSVWVAWIMRNLYCTMGLGPRQRLPLGGGRSWSHVGSLATVALSWSAKTW